MALTLEWKNIKHLLKRLPVVYAAVEKDINESEQDRAREWLAGLVAMQEGGSSEEFIESVKVDLFPDKVYVFTPKGEIRRLPRGSTCVDFAYSVHTDVGNRCVAAKIDRRLAPLRTELRNGQTVDQVVGAVPKAQLKTKIDSLLK